MLSEAWKNKQIFGEDFDEPDCFVVRSGDKYMFLYECSYAPPAWFKVAYCAAATKFRTLAEAEKAAEEIMSRGFKDVTVEGW